MKTADQQNTDNHKIYVTYNKKYIFKGNKNIKFKT